MIDPQSSSPWKKGCLIPSLILFLVLPFVLLGVGGLIWLGRESSARRQLNARVDTLRAEGVPVDNASIQAVYEEQVDSQNSEAWLAAIQELTSDAFQQSLGGVPLFDGEALERVPLPGEPWKDEQTTRNFLRQWKTLRDQLESLSIGAKPVRFPIQFDSINTLLPHTQEMRQAARLLHLHGQVALRDRDSAAVSRDIQALYGAARVNAGEPILISQLVSLAIDGLALQLLKDALQLDVLHQADLEALLSDTLVGTSIGGEWKLAMLGERAAMLPIFLDPSVVQAEVPRLPGRSRDALYYLDLMDRVLEASPDNLGDFRQQLADYEAETAQLAGANWLTKFDSVFTQLLTPALSHAGDAFVRKALQHRMAALAIGIRIYEDRHGRMPSVLDDLSEIPLDLSQLRLLGDQSFGYRLADDEAILWGFDFREVSTVPANPPSAEDVEDTEAWLRELWTWEMPHVTSDSP